MARRRPRRSRRQGDAIRALEASYRPPQFPRVCPGVPPLERWVPYEQPGVEKDRWTIVDTRFLFHSELGTGAHSIVRISRVEVYTTPPRSAVNELWVQPFLKDAGQTGQSTMAYAESGAVGTRAAVGYRYKTESQAMGPWTKAEPFVRIRSTTSAVELRVLGVFY